MLGPFPVTKVPGEHLIHSDLLANGDKLVTVGFADKNATHARLLLKPFPGSS